MLKTRIVSTALAAVVMAAGSAGACGVVQGDTLLEVRGAARVWAEGSCVPC